jgi:hypothetical protein
MNFNEVYSVTNTNGTFVVKKDGRTGKIYKLTTTNVKEEIDRQVEDLKSKNKLRPFTHNELRAFNFFDV